VRTLDADVGQLCKVQTGLSSHQTRFQRYRTGKDAAETSLRHLLLVETRRLCRHIGVPGQPQPMRKLMSQWQFSLETGC
jgi:hypothetical protein